MFIQKGSPQQFNLFREMQVIYFACHFLNIQLADILCQTVGQHLRKKPAPLKWIIQVHFIRTPYQMAGA
jgi:hypothetical protein